MAVQSRTSIPIPPPPAQPDVDILARWGVDRYPETPVTESRWRPSCPMTVDGAPKLNAIGAQQYEPAAEAPDQTRLDYGIDVVRMQRLQAMEFDITVRLVTWALARSGVTRTAQQIQGIAMGMLQANEGIDNAVTTEWEELRNALVARWDALVDAFTTARADFDVAVAAHEDAIAAHQTVRAAYDAEVEAYEAALAAYDAAPEGAQPPTGPGEPPAGPGEPPTPPTLPTPALLEAEFGVRITGAHPFTF